MALTLMTMKKHHVKPMKELKKSHYECKRYFSKLKQTKGLPFLLVSIVIQKQDVFFLLITSLTAI